MKALRSTLDFLWDFVVGDDWITAVGIVAGLGLTALLARSTSSVWWVLPLVVLGLLALYLWRVARASTRGPRP